MIYMKFVIMKTRVWYVETIAKIIKTLLHVNVC